ncbi:hypothetical protein ACL02U_23600 [Streptomyces sp. MS06]|uniref:hypothetical protein n=1 Tax=Streptomyces sp. MS06 TaxID=3385974 RepID=UPI0039A2D512
MFDRGRWRLSPELDDVILGRLVKSLDVPGKWALARGDSFYASRLSGLFEQSGSNWDRRQHRFSTLAGSLAHTAIPARWLSREPKNPDALILYACSGYVRMREYGAVAEPSSLIELCRTAAELNPPDPTPWALMIGISCLAHLPQREIFTAWNEAVSRDRWNRQAHLQMLDHLSPDNGGSYVRVTEFVDAVRCAVPADSPCIGIEMIAHVNHYRRALDRGGVAAVTAPSYWSQHTVSAALDRALNHWPKPGFLTHSAALADLNTLAYALSAARRAADAATVFEAIGSVVTPWPWSLDGDPLDEFKRRQRATHR